MEGFVFNTRRPMFADARLREALGLMFDFEWINANLFAGLYTRNNEFLRQFGARLDRPAGERGGARPARPLPRRRARGHSGRPLAPLVHDGTGRDREPASRALELLGEAG